ncbi:hypothetical protein psal_cds_372 [Pandoravirus salinus]|uniref:Uncharacterized protein n=1 Tax=Pandoravirus salinus TaxID=1349410 RepID=A0A291ATN5_9VIRU|nr:hypothetical protein psal_cds_372 [Pandoravirus salinus]ATE82167.1 hypothetical protein psal_cds_372 [Pandoravirus salinus]
MAHRPMHTPRDIEMTPLSDRDRVAWDRPVDDESDDVPIENVDVEMADVRRCAVRERMCVPRLTRRWATTWAALLALAAAALVFGPWFGGRLAPQYALVDRVQRWPCTVVNHTVLASWWGHGNALWQVPGVGVRLVRGDGSEADAVAWPRLLWHQSWMTAATVAPYLALYPVGATGGCHEDRETHTVALRDDIDDLGGELVACLTATLFAGALAFWGVYKLLGPRRIP